MNPQPVNITMIVDESGIKRVVQVPTEIPLTINLNGVEIVTLMTLGLDPENLVLGYLRNPRLVEHFKEILSMNWDWERETIFVKAPKVNIVDLKRKTGRKIVTTGCGEGTVFSCSIDKIYDHRFQPFIIPPNDINALCSLISKQTGNYKIAGSVHTCALCTKDQVLMQIEDVGRHNAADTIAGMMWQRHLTGGDKILYSTGRITSEIVIKAAMMGIPAILSRSGVTQLGLEIAQDLNMVLLARVKGKKFLVYNGSQYIDFEDSTTI